jgi:PAS domain S-box-containing protein
MNSEIRSILDVMPQGCQIVGFDWCYRYLNPAAEKHNGVAKAKLLGLSLMECWPGITTTRIFASLKSCLEQRTTQQLDNECIFPGSLRGWHRLTIEPIEEGVAIFSEDIAERKQAEAALRQSEERLQFALQSCQIGAWDISLEDHTAHRSLEHDRIFGYQELLPQWTLKDFLRHALPGYRAEVETMVREATAAGTGWTYQCQICRADGELRWIWFSGQHRVDSSGHNRVAGVVQDITERKRAEIALQESERKLSLVLECMSEGIMLFDADGNVIYQNPASLRVHGFALSEPGTLEYLALPVIWKGWDEQGSPLHFDQWPISRVIRGEHVQDQVLRARRADTGHEFYASCNGSPVHDDSGKMIFGFITIHDITKRKQAEEKELRLHEIIAQERDRLSALVDSMTDEVWFADTAGQFRLINPVGRQGFALMSAGATDVQELAASLEVLRPDGSPRPVEEAPPLRSLRGEVVKNQEELVRVPATGELRWRQVSAAPVRDSGGTIIGSVSVVRDITGIKRAEQMSRENEDRRQRQFLECVIANAGSCIAVMQGEELRYTMANQAFQAFAPDLPIIGRTYREVFPKAAAAGSEALLLQVLRTGEPRELEAYPAAVAGMADAVWQGQVVRLPAASGEEASVLFVAWNITGLKQVEAALRKSEQEFRTLAEAVPQIVWATQPDGWNTYFNQQWVDYTGLTLEESYGHGWNTPFHPDDQQIAWEAWQRATQENQPYSLECRLRRADGVYRWWLIRGEPIRKASGEVLKWFGTCTDIQELREAKDRATTYANRLIEMEEELRRGIARDLHDDIAQEITALSLNLAYVSRHLGDDTEKKLPLIMEDSRTLTKGVSRSVRNLMVELHPLQLEEHGLAVAIRAHAELFMKRFGIEITLDADPQFPRLTPQRETTLFRIAQEAMSNTVKHAAATKVTIVLSKEGEFVRLAITDDGKGFLPQGTSPQPTGSGWGLPNMRERARLIGGVLKVQTSLGQGTTISLELRDA